MNTSPSSTPQDSSKRRSEIAAQPTPLASVAGAPVHGGTGSVTSPDISSRTRTVDPSAAPSEISADLHNQTTQGGAPAIFGLVHVLKAEPLVTQSPAPEIGMPKLGYMLRAEPLTTGAPEIGGELPPGRGVHHLSAATTKRPRSTRGAFRQNQIRDVLLDQQPEWRAHGFPPKAQMSNREFLKIAAPILKKKLGLEIKTTRKSILRAVGRER